MQNQNARIAAQLVTNKMHEKGKVCQPENVQTGQAKRLPQQSLQIQQEAQVHTEQSQPHGTQELSIPGQGTVPSQQLPQQNSDHDGNPKADFRDIYRTGNFGEHFGKVNVRRAKRWLLAHGILSSFMFVFALAATIMMRDYTNTVFKDILLAFTWMTTIEDWMLVASAAFFLFKLSTLKNPLTTLMIMRTCSALNFALNLFFFLVGLLGLLINANDFVRLTPKEVGFLQSIFVMMSILMVGKTVTGYSFVFLWWKNPAYCSCLAAYCVFDEGEELAPGVANSAGTQNIIAFGQAAASFGDAMKRV